MTQVERNLRSRKGRRERYMCGHLGCKVRSGEDYYCATHREYYTDKERSRRARKASP